MKKFLNVIFLIIIMFPLTAAGAQAVTPVPTAAAVVELLQEKPAKIIIVEKPIFYPETQTASLDEAGLKDKLIESVKTPLNIRDIDGGVYTYDYYETFNYYVFIKPLACTDIQLQPGEVSINPYICSDLSRFLIQTSLSYQNNIPVEHFYIKPVAEGLEATLIINTNKRSYYMTLKSYSDIYFTRVKWRYPVEPEKQLLSPVIQQMSNNVIEGNLFDINNLVFDYETKPSKKNLSFVPVVVFDDGKKTFIILPANIINKELPALFLNDKEMINYRTKANILIIDQVALQLTLKIRNDKVVIKKGASNG